MSTLTIDIWSDVMCPWCLVGWGNLRQALDRLEGEIEAEVRWHAFELNPDMPDQGEERTAHIMRKYGTTSDQSRAVQERMRAAAAAAQVSLDYHGSEPAPAAMMWNTFAAHRLLTWAGAIHGHAAQTRLKLALFEAHFNARRAIGDETVLLEVAQAAGFARGEAEAALADERWARETRADEQAAWDMNISGVPAMVIAGRFMVPGAQGADTYVDVLRKVAATTAA